MLIIVHAAVQAPTARGDNASQSIMTHIARVGPWDAAA